jgi:hypothetical protein
MATALIEHVLAHQLAQNDAVPAAAAHVASLIQQQRIIAHAELEEGLNGPVIHRYAYAGYLPAPTPGAGGYRLDPLKISHFRLLIMTASITRWQLRLTALLSASNAPEVRTSTTLLLAAGKTTLTAAQSVLASPKSDPTLFLSALEIARLILAKSTWHPEWARENVGAQTVQKLVSRLVEAASADGSEVSSG